MVSRSDFSVVEYFSDSSGSECGYCKSRRSYISSGMWAHTLGVKEYENLIDRGWRRSGHYCYKPHMPTTCCPMYTIRCEVENIRLSKSQKKVLKKFYNYLRFGDVPRDFPTEPVSDSGSSEGEIGSQNVAAHEEEEKSAPSVIELNNIIVDSTPNQEDESNQEELGACALIESKEDLETTVEGDFEIPSTSTGEAGASSVGETSPARPPVRKAKLIRLENKYRKLINRGLTEEEAIRRVYDSKKQSPERKILTLEEYFTVQEDMTYFAHKFVVKLVPVVELLRDPVVLHGTYNLYKKYQITVHGDSPEDCAFKQFNRFLVSSPLKDTNPNIAPPSGFGSFHQQYWLDGKLIAVGVIDILPSCVSSVYFFYDPDLKSLSLGTYGSLHEIFFTRSLMKLREHIKYYYLGYYIHDCPKMSYKARYSPSYLLCPETYTWHKLEKCLPKLDENKYSRLEEDPNAVDEHGEINMRKVMVLHRSRALAYTKYKRGNLNANDDDVREYAKLVGSLGYESLLLYRR